MRKKIDKPYIKLLICIACAMIIGLISTLGYGSFRYSRITGDKGKFQIDANYISSTCSEQNMEGNYTFEEPGILQIQFPENTYIDKLEYTYDTKANMQFGLIVYTMGEDGTETETMLFDGVFLSASLSVINIHQEVYRICFLYGEIQNELNVSDFYVDNSFRFNPMIMIFVTLSSFLILYLVMLKKENSMHLVRTVFVTVFIMGLIMMIVGSPVISGWDEQTHFARTYDMAVGRYGEQTSAVVQYMEQNAQMLNDYHVSNYEERINMIQSMNRLSEFPSERIDEYHLEISSIGYVLQIIGYKIGTVLNLPFYVSWYFGKLMNLLLYAAGMAGIVYILPVGKYVMSVLALMPTMLFVSTTYTYDITVTVFVMLSLAIWFREILNRDTKFTYKWRILMIVFMAIGCMPKAIYAPLILCALFIPKDKFYSKKDCYIFRGVIIIACLLILSTFVLPTLIAPSQTGDLRGGNTSVAGQLGFILSHPFSYAKNLLKCLACSFVPFVIGTEGLGNMAYWGSISLMSVHLIILVVVLLTDQFNNNQFKFKLKYKIVISCCVITAAVLIWTALYLSYTEVGLPTINGVQGRYYFPFLFFVYMIFAPQKVKNTYKKENYQACILTASSLVLLIEMVIMYVIPSCL
jgi:uncharacterized membrane protein